jgi:hypothetical protein
MIERQLQWRRSYAYDDLVWTARTRPDHRWYNHKVDLSFTLKAGIAGSIVNKNAVLTIKKRAEGKKIANIVVMKKEFKNSYTAKCFLDSLLYASKIMFDTIEEGEEWFFKQLNYYKDAAPPEQKTSLPNSIYAGYQI